MSNSALLKERGDFGERHELDLYIFVGVKVRAGNLFCSLDQVGMAEVAEDGGIRVYGPEVGDPFAPVARLLEELPLGRTPSGLPRPRGPPGSRGRSLWSHASTDGS